MGCNALEMLESGKCKTTMYGLYILTIKGDIVNNDLILLGYDGT